ncbi:phosphoribosyltransferase [Mesorhizobium australicum]|uniref:phosphoribosyltransferase n=1 Tax=Mesorhizobium australicum TaxID=536018 RepID=UPI00333C722A
MTELGLQFDAIVRVPSSRNDNLALYGACLANWPDAEDLSRRLSRAGRVKAADAGTVADMVAELVYAPGGNENEIRSLLIVDESSSTGKTAAAVLDILQANGVPAYVEVTLASLW